MVLVGGVAHFHLQAQIAEARRATSRYLDGGTSVLEFHTALVVVLQEVVADGVSDGSILRHAILVELHFDARFLAWLVNPVSMVGHGHPKHVTTIGIILGLHRRCHEQEEQNS